MRRLTTSGLLILSLAQPSPARAQGAQAPLALTLADAVARGLAHAPQIAEAQSREVAAGATAASREALGRPLLALSTGYVRVNHVPEFGISQGGVTAVIFPDVPNNYRARAELDVPLYTAGRVGDVVTAAAAEQQAATFDRRTVEADVALDVARAYWALVMTRENVGVLERSLQRADATVADVRTRQNAGLVPPNELLSAQAQRARVNVRLIQVRNDALLAEADLARAVGAPPGQPIQTLTPVDVPTPAAAEFTGRPLAALVEQATGARTERQALDARRQGLRASAEAALAVTKPQLAALAAVEPSRPNQRFVPRVDEWKLSWDLGVNLSWSLWDGGRARADRAALVAQSDALQHRLDQFDEGVALEVRQRTLDLDSNRAALAASDEAVAAATEAQRVVNERFAAGVATNTEMLDAEVARLEAELERTRLQAALRLGEARLLRAVGGR